MKLFAPCPPKAEDILSEELRRLGAQDVTRSPRGVRFHGNLELAYRSCLELRTASRILVELFSGDAQDEDELYSLIRSHAWGKDFTVEDTFACRVTGVPRDKDPRYATLRMKDGIVDWFSHHEGKRPSVDRRNPDIRLEARWNGRRAWVYLNFSGAPLHERGYRLERTEAVLRETTAAMMLYQADWPKIASQGGAFVDPVCGSGTLLAEAAMMAVGAPCGAMRKHWGFESWKKHDLGLWTNLHSQAQIRYGESLQRVPMIVGYDRDSQALEIARANLRRAGLGQVVRLEHHDLHDGRPDFWPHSSTGLICADPPYGERLTGDPSPLYGRLGELFREVDSGWNLALLAPDKKTASSTCLRAREYRGMVTGGMDVVLGLYERKSPNQVDEPVSLDSAKPETSQKFPKHPGAGTGVDLEKKPIIHSGRDPKASSLAQALERNLEALGKWAQKSGATSYRIWDSDMPEFNAAVDFYEGKWLHVQEYAAPAKIPEDIVRRRAETLIEVFQEVMGFGDEAIFLKTRRRGVRPYGRMGNSHQRFVMRENGCRFWINLTDRLDTGIFLDHRPTRKRIRDAAQGKRVLNLFAYTGTASVAAALGGASATTTVDVSNTYLRWARDNFELNRIPEDDHRFVKADAFDFLKTEQETYDIIFLDPPTYSNGAGRQDWSVEKHHAAIIRLALKRLNPQGVLLFSENYRRFALDHKLKRQHSPVEITRETTDPDFARRARGHRCWEFRLS